MAPTACGSAAIFIDSTACCCTLVCSNSKHHPFSPEGKPAVGGSPLAGLLSYFLYVNRLQCNMPSCSCLFQQQAPSTPPQGRTRPQATPRRAGPPAARAAREPSGRATRGRTPPGGAASPRAAAGRCAALCGAGGTRRRIAARYGGAVAPACGRLTVSPYCSSFGFCADVLSSE